MNKIYKNLLASCLFIFSSFSFANYTLPDYEKITLPNGLVVYLMEQHEVPLVDLSVVINVGAIDDNEHAGLAYLTAKSILLGTEKLNKSELDQQVDFIGAELFSTSNLEFTTVGASFAKKDTTHVIGLLRDVLLTPRFDTKEVEKFKQRHLLNLTQRKESPRTVINTYFNRMIFGQEGYGSVVTGDQPSVASLTVNDIKLHHSKWFSANNAALIVVGDFNTDEMKKQLSKVFGSWSASKVNVERKKVLTTNAANKSTVLLVDKPDARESTFLIGGKGISRSNKDSVGLSVINTVLGGRFTSWLNDELRVNAGLTYGARSRFTSYRHDGSFAISTFTKTSTTVEAMDLALKTYARLWEQGIDKETLASAKAYVKGQFPPKFETPSQLASLLANMYGYQFDENYINNFEQQVDSLTVEKSNVLINTYFPQNHLQFVVIGKADEIRNQLEKYGQIIETNIKDSGFNIH